MCKVKIRRQPQSHKMDEVHENCISNAHWDNVCGGLQMRVATVSVYGYMDYHELTKTEVANSGSHDWGYNLAKICMNKSDNMGKGNEAYEPAYCRFIVEADHNSKSRPIDYKRTRTVSEFLKDNPGVSRNELMEGLASKRTDAKALREAINILLKAGYLKIEGSPRGQKSKLSLTDTFRF